MLGGWEDTLLEFWDAISVERWWKKKMMMFLLRHMVRKGREIGKMEGSFLCFSQA